MIKKITLSAFFTLVLMTAVLFGLYTFVLADSAGVGFESPDYSLGNIDGQDGWSKTGGFDVEVVSSFGVPGFGSQSLRFSNAVTSGSFGDQTFSKPLAEPAGEVNAQDTEYSETRHPHFEAEFELRSMQLPQQPGLFLSVSPDRGDGARMSYLGFEDTPTGIDVIFYDTPGETNPATFAPTTIATGLSRAETHKFKFVIDFVEGPSNDVVEIYIDDVLVHTGTTWENYYRFDDESNPNLVNESRVVRTLLFRAGGTAAPDTLGLGYLIDNVLLDSSGASAPTESTTVVRAEDLDPNGPSPVDVIIGGLDKWFFYNDEIDEVDNTLGSFVEGPDTPPLGDGSAEISVTDTERRNLATYQFSGTPLSAIRTMKFSTYNPSAGNGGGVDRSAYLNFNVDFDGSDTWQRRLAFVPRQNGTVVQNSWQEWDAIDGGDAMYSYSGPTWPGTATPGTTLRSWNDLLASYPGIRIRVTDSWLGMRVGEPYGDGYTENLDKFVFGTNTETQIFDFEPTAPTPDVTVTVVKYVNGVHATDVNASSLSFPMESSWDAENIGAGSGSYTLSSPSYEAVTTEMTNGADYTTEEILTEANVGASCADGKPFALVGYTTGDSELSAAGETPTTTPIALTGIATSTYIIVWNETCSTDGTLTLEKDVVNDDTGSSVDTDWTLSASGPTPVSGVEGDASITNAVVTPGTYDLSESGPSGYTAGDWVCVGGNQIDGDTVEIAAGDHVTCTIENDDNDVVLPPLANACDTPGVAPSGYTLLEGTTEIDNVTLAPFTMFVGNGNNDRVTATADGDYIICMGDGHDRITLGNGNFTIDAGSGYNTIIAGNGSGFVKSGALTDRITVGDGEHTIVAGEGFNKIITGDGNKHIITGSESDDITTGAGNDVIEAGDGYNKVKSGAGDDNITTGVDNDRIDGGADTDTCNAGGGNNNVQNCEL